MKLFDSPKRDNTLKDLYIILIIIITLLCASLKPGSVAWVGGSG
jgi:hypothetical protein